MTVMRFTSAIEMASAAAREVCAHACDAVTARGVFTLALAGGSSPVGTYERLAAPPSVSSIPWDRTHVFWGDDRCVPHDHPDSNVRRARDAFLSAVPLPGHACHPIPAGDLTPDERADAYEDTLREFFASHGLLSPDDMLVFDVIILGIGPDGHTASLFPDNPHASRVSGRLAVATPPAPTPPHVPRVTLTLPVLNAARHVLFLVTHADEKECVREIVTDRAAAGKKYPAGRVRAADTALFITPPVPER